MNVIGQGHKGIVVADETDPDYVNKFYLAKEQWEKEKADLRFIADIQKQGFIIGCKIPKIIDSSKGKWKINGREYNFCSKMDFIPGTTAKFGNEKKNIRPVIGRNLGELIFNMHTRSKTYVDQWGAGFGEEDRLLSQIIYDKAVKVMKEEKDKDVRNWVERAKKYLEDRKDSLSSGLTLSHQDLNLSNIIIDGEGRVEGLVDWVGFGLTNPTLSLYQLATKRNLWHHIKKAYESSGGRINYDILYASATIHLAWAPIACKELGREEIDLGPDESKDSLELMYSNFVKVCSS